MRHSAYPAYTASGIEWVGDVPEHWNVSRLGDKALLVNGYPFDSEAFSKDEGVPLVRIRDLFSDSTEVSWPGPIVKEAEISDGDILIGMDGDFNVAWWSSGKALLNQRVCCLRAYAGELLQRYLFYCLPLPLKALNEITYSTTVKHLSSLDVLKFPLFTPPVSEQQAIADFLDAQTAKIDALVAKKRELIEKLKEKRAALISLTVTRGLPPEAARAAGLDPHPRLKPSGVEWLGDVPEHWEVQPLSRLGCTIQTGPFGSQLHESDYVENGIPLINPAHISGEQIQPDSESSVDEATWRRLGRYHLQAGDIVMGRRGEIGRCAVVPFEGSGWVTGTGSFLIRFPQAKSSYYARVFRSTGFSGLLELNAVGTTMLNLSPAIVGRMVIPVPPIPEQAAIADYLDRESARVDRMVSIVEEAIDRLQEYRTALITAAVTGKIDVRSAAVRYGSAMPEAAA